MKTVKLTDDQLNKLEMYLLMSTQHRKSAREAWESLSKEKDADGNPVFKNAESNASWYAELEITIEEILKALKEAW